MKIAILSTSLTVGGAAIVTAHLAEALSGAGHEVRTFTLPEGRRELRPAFLAERLGIFLRNGLRRDTLFKVSTADCGRRGIVNKVRAFAPDVIILGWINQGLLSIPQIRRLGEAAPIVWVMHDMWNFTGICHHSLGCLRFSGRCGKCPMLAEPVRGDNDLSHKGWLRKRALYDALPSVRFVAVSSWVQEQARRSSLLRERDVTVIPNVYPLDRYTVGEKEPGLVAMGAQRLDDPIKGLHHAIEALNMLPADSGVHAVFFGSLKDPHALDGLRIPYEYVGPLSAEGVGELLNRAQVVLSTSLYETLGNTLVEGQASGAIPVAFDRGGQVDVIDHMRSGFLAPFGDTAAIARGILWALSGRVGPEDVRHAAEGRYSGAAVARRFEKLFCDSRNIP